MHILVQSVQLDNAQFTFPNIQGQIYCLGKRTVHAWTRLHNVGLTRLHM